MAGEIYPLDAQLRVPNTAKEHISLSEMAAAFEVFKAEIAYIINVLKASEAANDKKEFSIQIGIHHYLNGITTKQSSSGGTNMFEIGCYCGDGGGDGEG